MRKISHKRKKQMREAQEKFHLTKKEAGYKRTVIYTSPETSEALRRIRKEEDMSNEDILREGLELLLLAKGIVTPKS